MRKTRSDGGMTLVEVLLAAFILGVGMMVLVTASSRCVAVMRKAAVFQAARWTLDRGEADHPLIRTNDIKMLEVDATEYPGGMFYERIVEDDEDEDGLFVIRSRVSWSSHERILFEEAVRYMLEDPSAKK